MCNINFANLEWKYSRDLGFANYREKCVIEIPLNFSFKVLQISFHETLISRFLLSLAKINDKVNKLKASQVGINIPFP